LPIGATLELMKSVEVEAIIGAVVNWATERDDIRAVALVGSWARGNSHQTSDIDLLLLSNRDQEYRRRPEWLSGIDFGKLGYRLQSRESVAYGAVWSEHIRLLPAADVELTIANCSWAKTAPVDDGTRDVVKDGFRIVLDKDASLAKLVDVVMSV
jgi:predicted nucleotidyltransferase